MRLGDIIIEVVLSLEHFVCSPAFSLLPLRSLLTGTLGVPAGRPPGGNRLLFMKIYSIDFAMSFSAGRFRNGLRAEQVHHFMQN